LAPPDRLSIAKRRLQLVLKKTVVSNARTLEQKISDAGPGDMRVDPHVLTRARNELKDAGTIVRITAGVGNTPWFHLRTAAAADVQSRLAHLVSIHDALRAGNLTLRMGQTLEIAAYRALIAQPALMTFGAYTDLDDHDDSTLYSKEEPPSVMSGRRTNGKLDFVLTCAGHTAGVELKNVREWLYPDRDEVTELLRKCTDLNIVPVLIARRIPYVTFKLLTTCGVIVHQTYNQLFPAADAVLAEQVRNKSLLGYHDVRTGNEPDARLKKFVDVNLPRLIVARRDIFDSYKDLLSEFAHGAIDYSVFAAKVRRRAQGTNENHDWGDGVDIW
jgi:hypothetical protein